MIAKLFLFARLEKQHHVVRWLIGLSLVLLIHTLGSNWIPQRAERFWMLLPIDVLVLSFWLKLFPRPRFAQQTRRQQILAVIVLLAAPIGLYLGLISLCQSPFSVRECLLVEYFFVFCVEIPMLYYFNGLESLDQYLKPRLKPIPPWGVILMTRLAGYLLLIPVLLSVFAIHRPKLIPAPYRFLAEEFSQHISFPSREAHPLTLRGEFLTHPHPKGTVIVCHGVGANRGDIEAIVETAYFLGFHVLAFDFRGHGESDGHTVTYGERERFDVLGAYDYCLSRDDVDPEKLYALGVSMGGSSLMLALPEMEHVQAALIDSSYADLSQMVHYQLRIFPAWLRSPLVEIANITAQLEVGVNVHNVRPIEAACRVACPVTLIHGQDDRIVPCEQSEQLCRSLPELIEFYSPEEVGHIGTAIVDGYRYQTLLKKTFQLRKVSGSISNSSVVNVSAHAETEEP